MYETVSSKPSFILNEREVVLFKANLIMQGDTAIQTVLKMYEKIGMNVRLYREMPRGMTREQATAFYANIADKPFFPDVVDYMSQNPAIVMVLHGPNAIEAVRKLHGETNPLKAGEKTIRRMFYKEGDAPHANSVHAASSIQEAMDQARILEIQLFN